MKKALELSILCDAEVALIVFSNTGKLSDFSSSSMTKTLERHRKCSNLAQDTSRDIQNSNFELSTLKQKAEGLHKRGRHLLGEDLDQLTEMELQQLEQQLQEGLSQVTSRKAQFMFDLIQELRRKEQLLEGVNKSLHKKFSELEGQHPGDQHPIQLLGGACPTTAEKYGTHVQSANCEPTLQIGCPSAHTGNINPGKRHGGNYGGQRWIL